MKSYLSQSLKQKKKAFTLLEMLVVLAILAILIAIAIPVYKNQKEKAAITAHNANVSVLETAAESYRQDHRDFPKDISDLQKEGYIKQIPPVPTSNEKNLKEEKKYSIDKDGKVHPEAITKSDETQKK